MGIEEEIRDMKQEIAELKKVKNNNFFIGRVTGVNSSGFPPIASVEIKDFNRLDANGEPVTVVVDNVIFPQPSFRSKGTIYSPPAVGDQMLLACPSGDLTKDIYWAGDLPHADVNVDGSLSWNEMPGVGIGGDGVQSTYTRDVGIDGALDRPYAEDFFNIPVGADPTGLNITGRSVDMLATEGVDDLGNRALEDQDLTKIRMTPKNIDFIHHTQGDNIFDDLAVRDWPIIAESEIEQDSMGDFINLTGKDKIRLDNRHPIRLFRPVALNNLLSVVPIEPYSFPMSNPIGIEFFIGIPFSSAGGDDGWLAPIEAIMDIRGINIEIDSIVGDPGKLHFNILRRDTRGGNYNATLGGNDHSLGSITPKVGTNNLTLQTPIELNAGRARTINFDRSYYYSLTLSTDIMDIGNYINLRVNYRGDWNVFGNVPFIREGGFLGNIIVFSIAGRYNWNLSQTSSLSRNDFFEERPIFTRRNITSEWERAGSVYVFQFQILGRWKSN